MRQLPTYPAKVLTDPNLTVNLATARSPEAYVRTMMQLPVTDPRYQIDQYGTKCNFYVQDALALFGYDLASVMANLMVGMADAGNLPGFAKMVVQDALMNANMGCPTWAGLENPTGHGHVVMVLPCQATLLPQDLAVAQAGRVNFFGRTLAYSWPRSAWPLVKFYGAP